MRSQISLFLESIPSSTDVPISLTEFARANNMGLQALETTVLFLQLFNTIEIEVSEGNKFLRAKNLRALNFLKCLKKYVENDYRIVSNWSGSKNFYDEDLDTFLKRGVNLLFAMEQRRIKVFRDKKAIKNVRIQLFVIKANVKGAQEPRFLLEYNYKSGRYQLLGGIMSGSSPDDIKSISRLANKDLINSKLNPICDYSTEPLFKPIITSDVSRKQSILTDYIVYYTFVKLKKKKISTSEKDRWFTLDEIQRGKTSDGIEIHSPFENHRNKKSLYKKFIELPLSTDRVQLEPTGHFKLTKKYRNKRLKVLLKDEESHMLEFKSSARWDRSNNQVNKTLEKSILKTIASFLNSKGGILLIGIDDDKRILGIEKDLDTIGKKNEDGYTQYLTSIIASHLQIEVMSRIKISYEAINKHLICIIDVERSDFPVFLKNIDDREFYIRTANSTRELNVEQVYKYISFNWQ